MQWSKSAWKPHSGALIAYAMEVEENTITGRVSLQPHWYQPLQKDHIRAPTLKEGTQGFEGTLNHIPRRSRFARSKYVDLNPFLCNGEALHVRPNLQNALKRLVLLNQSL